MPYDPAKHHRRSIRLQGYDYARAGAYFVTICSEGHLCLFGEVVGEQMVVNAAGAMVGREWQTLPARFPRIELDAFVVMPNHMHAILVLTGDAPSAAVGANLVFAPSPDEATVAVGASLVFAPSPDEATVAVGANLVFAPNPRRANDRTGGDHKDRPYDADAGSVAGNAAPTPRPHGTLPGTVGRIVQAYKSIATHEYVLGVRLSGWPRFPGRLWQRNYYEHVIRDEDELKRIRRYIEDNPAKWAEDRLNPACVRRR